MDREELIKQVTWARLVKEKKDNLLKLKLTDSELLRLTSLEIPDGQNAIEFSASLREVSRLDIRVAAHLLLERWKERYSESGFRMIKDEIVANQPGHNTNLKLPQKKSAIARIFSHQKNETVNFIVNIELKNALNELET